MEEDADIRMAVEGAVGEAAGLDTGRSHYMVPGREDIETFGDGRRLEAGTWTLSGIGLR